jgi:citrate lyase subunit beta/citryl-CoA lyase
MLEKARTLPADAVILDLEDAVPSDEKPAARTMVREAVETGSYGSQVVVRINALNTGLGAIDLEAILSPGIQAICLPKAETAAEVTHLASLLTALEGARGLPSGSVLLLLMVETALGVLNAFEMAKASERVRALCLGGEDLSLDLGAIRTQEGLELAHARAKVVVAARAAGVAPIDTVFTDLNDQDGLLADTRLARQLGYSGKLLIHPRQIETVHRAFAPSEEELAYARRVVEGFEATVAKGGGVFALDGKMIDAPIVARAREALAYAKKDRE